MTTTPPLELAQSDLWLLVSIYAASSSNSASLTEVISSGDRINRSLFSSSELRLGMARLQRNGLACFTDNKFSLLPNGLSLVASALAACPKDSSALQVLLALRKQVKTAPNLGHPPEEEEEAWHLRISDEAISLAIQTYKTRMDALVAQMLAQKQLQNASAHSGQSVANRLFQRLRNWRK